jgi:hypothetical protein
MQLTEEEMTLIIHGLMATYQDSEEWERGKNLAKEIMQTCNIQNTVPQTFVAPAKAKSTNKLRDLEALLDETEFTPAIMTTDAIFKDFDNIGNDALKFIYGKQGQLIIQRWEGLDTVLTPVSETIALNKACVDMLIDFLNNDGKSAGNLLAYSAGDNGMTKVLEAYLDTDGNQSYQKHLTYAYNVIEKELTIEKENDKVCLTKYETLILKKFLSYHLV